ncbi:hypothetical protein BUALT_Bualt04G0132300 [Buddleja alternifolia]|uniref:PGG domain-containing protein n=1 Tax=Buddleja alternifolia TaxID=168488 RepID=A0AAV6XWM0_9LAMI|nr:hypothetical protein BUALT_Bualt04G0132300 [Buddleja alternifolia]
MEGSLLGVAEKRLYNAAASGDTKSLQELLEEDPFLLDRVSFTCPNKTPLHVATMKCHRVFVQEILNQNPQLAEGLDSLQSSALHLASAKGYVGILKKLLSAAPDMCLSRDCQGRNPIHIAAMKGHCEVLAELVRTAPLAAREKVEHGQTVLHLCVKHGQLEALKILVPNLNELLDAKDDDSDMILHMAVRDKQTEIIQYLVGSTNIYVNSKNSKGQTAMDILDQNPTDSKNSEIKEILRPKLCNSNNTQSQPVNWLTQKRDTIMVVAVLIATMAFQACVSPPGGVWQENSTRDPHVNQYWAGEAVIAHSHPNAYKNFMFTNSMAFFSSVCIILLLISGLPFRHRLVMWILMVIMWLSVTSLSATYSISIVMVTPKKHMKSLVYVLEIGLAMWCVGMGILLVGNAVRLIDRWLKNKGIFMDRWLKNKGIFLWRHRRFRILAEVNRENATREIV